MTVTTASYGKTPAGEEVTEYTITNGNNVEVKVISFGAIITGVRTPDASGKVDDITLGYNKLEDWLTNPTYFGCAVGRVGNRVANATFSLDGTEYKLEANNDQHALHGGSGGFHKRHWGSAVEGNGVKLTYVSADMEEGYPGELTTTITYSLGEDNEFGINYKATTTKKTIVNLTNHSYFNLAGAGSGKTHFEHEMHMACRGFTPVGADLIPTGEVSSVEGTPFDFREQKSFGAEIGKVDNGYDHNYCVNRVGVAPGHLAHVCTVSEPASGRTLAVKTTEPGCQFYCGGFLDGTNVGREGKAYPKYGGFCLETQHYPDSINQATFESIVVAPGQTYDSTTVYTFGVNSKRRRDD